MRLPGKTTRRTRTADERGAWMTHDERMGVYQRYRGNNPQELADLLEVPVLETSLPDGLFGMQLKLLGQDFICLSPGLSDEDRRATLAHELGHLLLHDDQNTLFLASSTYLNVGKLEEEADRFAAKLLLPDSCFSELENDTLEHLSQRTGVPLRLVQLRWQMWQEEQKYR